MKTIVFCVPGNNFTDTFLKCWTILYDWCLKNNIRPILSNAYTSNVYYVRSLCLKLSNDAGTYQKPFNGLDYDYICWIDSDMVFSPKNLQALIQADKDVVSGIYMMQNGKEFTTVLNWDEDHFLEKGKFQFLTASEAIKLVEEEPIRKCAYTGLGFTLMKKGVIEKVPYPPFMPYTHKYESKNGVMEEFASEDVSLFRKLEKLGIDSYVDLRVRVGHEKLQIM